MYAISSYHGNRPTHNTHKNTDTQTGAITIHCAAGSATSGRCAYFVTSRRHDNRLTNDSLSFVSSSR